MKSRTMVYLEPEQLQSLQKEARNQRISLAELMRRLVKNHLTIEVALLTRRERVEILMDSQPIDFTIDELRLMSCAAIALLVEERKKNAKLS